MYGRNGTHIKNKRRMIWALNNAMDDDDNDNSISIGNVNCFWLLTRLPACLPAFVDSFQLFAMNIKIAFAIQHHLHCVINE